MASMNLLHYWFQWFIQVGIGITNALINAQKAVNKAFTVENLPVISTSVAYGIYMVVVSNLRYFIFLEQTTINVLESLTFVHNQIFFCIKKENLFMNLFMTYQVPSTCGNYWATDSGTIATPKQTYTNCSILYC